MKYFATIDDQTYEISVEADERISIDGVEMVADLKCVGNTDLYSLVLDSASHEVLVQPEPEQLGTRSLVRNTFGVMIEGTRYLVRVQDERSRRLALADRSLKPSSGELSIRAPIPGLMVKVSVAVGQAVREGEIMATLEAMKMENDLRAPRDGTVHEVRVEAGAQVTLGQVLIILK